MITTVPDVRTVERQTHGVTPVLYTRSPAGGPWVPLQVVEGTITLAEVGAFPLRTLQAVVLPEDATEAQEELGDNLSIFGSWIRAGQVVRRLDRTTFTVHHGTYRLTKVTRDVLTGALSIEAHDAGIRLDECGIMALVEGRNRTNETYVTFLERMITLAMLGIPKGTLYSSLLDRGTASTTLKPKTTPLQFTDERTEACRHVARLLNRALVPGSAWGGPLWKLIAIPAITDPVDVDIKIGHFGSLLEAGFDETFDRAEIFNMAAVTYTRTTKEPTGARDRIEERRMIVGHTDADSPIREGGPFGRVTRMAEANEVDTDAEALAAVTAAVSASLRVAREYSIETTPVYGIEPGDVVMVTALGGEQTRGLVVGGTIPLHADGGAWSLTLKAYQVLDQAWRTRRIYMYEDASDKIEDRADWRNYPALGNAVDLEENFAKGWSSSGATRKNTKAALELTATGGAAVYAATFHSWADKTPSEHRYKATVRVTSVNHSARVRVGLDYNPGGTVWGSYRDFKPKQTISLTADATIPSSASTISIRVEMWGIYQGRAPLAGHLFKITSAAMEYAVRETS